MTSASVSWFARTRLRPPVIPADLLAREPLSARLLAAARTARLTLVSAVAGAGKTTALAVLARDLAPVPVAWLSLDEEDNDPQFFFPALVAALRSALPGMGHDAEAMLENPAGQQPRRFAAVLINDILEAGDLPAVLILDDLHHLASPALTAALDYLVERAPEGFHIVAGTRYEPALNLARPRTRGQLAEFATADLLLAPGELRAWFSDQFGLELDEPGAAHLHGRVDGWMAGARLLALSLRRQQPGGPLGLAASPEAHERELFEYLASEVLAAQEPSIRAFLLETSILAELTPGLCRAVTGADDAAAILEELHRRNLFIEQLPGASGDTAPGPVYRYHNLFALFLRRQLGREQPDRVAALHLRAAAAQHDPARAVRHYLAAGAPEQAAGVIAAAAATATVRDLAPLCRLIEELPPRFRSSRPWLDQLVGADLARKGLYEQARPSLERALAGFEAEGDRHGAGHALVYLGEVFTCLADGANARPTLEASLAADLTPAQRVTSEMNLAWVACYEGDWDAVDARLDELLARFAAEPGLALAEGIVLSLGPQFAFSGVGAPRLMAFCDAVFALAGPGMGPAQAGARAYRAYLRFLAGDLASAREDATIAAAMCEDLGGFAHLELYTDHVLLFAALAEGDRARFDALIARAIERAAARITYRQWLASYLYLRGREGWLRGDHEAAPRALGELRATTLAHPLPDAAVPGRLLEALAAAAPADAERAFRAAIEAQDRARHALLATSARLGLAAHLSRQGNHAAALQELATASAFIERHVAPGLVLQEGTGIVPLLRAGERAGVAGGQVRRALELLSASPAPGSPAPGGLSRRELEVLALLAEGATNQQIADRLVITLGTAKRHTINIYSRLGATNRTQAVALARARGLLPGPRV